MRMLCQICAEFIGEVSIPGVPEAPGRPAIAALHYPISGAMIGSPDPFHQVPAPFDATAEWQFMMCPYGRTHRPMIADDVIKTEKGMIRLPKDGGPAFIDPEAPGAVDRESIPDQAVQISDEEAERQAREILQGGPKVVVSDEVPDNTVLVVDGTMIVESKEPIPSLHLYEINHDPDVSGFICAKCSEKFKTKKQLMRHLGAAHKPAPPAEKIVGDKIRTPMEFPCPVCKKAFPTEKAMKGHLGGAHKPVKKAGKKGKK